MQGGFRLRVIMVLNSMSGVHSESNNSAIVILFSNIACALGTLLEFPLAIVTTSTDFFENL